MRNLFDAGPVYVLGRVRKDRLITYDKRYTVSLPFKYTGDVFARITNRAELFFEHRIFNSYVVAEEENVYILHGKKLTFIVKGGERLAKDRIYIFETVEDCPQYRKVELYRRKTYRGRYRDGKFVSNESSDTRSAGPLSSGGMNAPAVGCMTKDLFSGCPEAVMTARGVLIPQRNHQENDHVFAEWISAGIFVEKDNGLKEMTGTIVSTNPCVVRDGDIKVYIYEKPMGCVGDKVTVRITEEIFGRYAGSFRLFNIKVGMVADALVQKVTDKAVFVEIDGIVGRLKLDECYKVKTKYVRGVVYRVDEERQRFEFSVRRYHSMVKERELEEAVIKLPFSESENGLEDAPLPQDQPQPSDAVAIALNARHAEAMSVSSKELLVKHLCSLVEKGVLEDLPEETTFRNIAGKASRYDAGTDSLDKKIRGSLGYSGVVEVLDRSAGKRGLSALFARLVGMDWETEQAKQIFKRWLEHEKNCGGDVEKVKEMAKAYVSQVSGAFSTQ